MTKLTQYFKGFYEYEQDDGIISIPFVLNLLFDGTKFSGSSIDEETKDLFSNVKVEGFLEGDLISFIKTYPFEYFWDEQDQKMVANKNFPEHRVTYQGHYNKSTKKYEGEWEIMIDETLLGGGVFKEQYISGYWEIERD